MNTYKWRVIHGNSNSSQRIYKHLKALIVTDWGNINTIMECLKDILGVSNQYYTVRIVVVDNKAGFTRCYLYKSWKDAIIDRITLASTCIMSLLQAPWTLFIELICACICCRNAQFTSIDIEMDIFARTSVDKYLDNSHYHIRSQSIWLIRLEFD